MTASRIRPMAGLRVTGVVVALAVLAPLVLAAPSWATAHHPTGAFAPFADCPLSNPSVRVCTVASASNGEFTIGNKTVPITKVLTIQGGLYENPETGELVFTGAEDGNTLSKTPLPVPGGLLGMVIPKSIPGWLRGRLEKFTHRGLADVTATTELAGPASAIKLSFQNLLSAEGVALQLPVKIKLDNWLLGEDCYIGSNIDPILLNLTTGSTSPPEPNKPIKGNVGTLEFKEEFTLGVLNGNSLVDNAFAAPKATGCGGFFAPVVDRVIDTLLGLPASAGHNTAILNDTLEIAAAETVKASE
jgi:hypothetical protein